MLKLKLQYFGHLMWTADSLEQVPDPGKDWRQKEKRASEDEMAGWHHRYNGHELGQTSRDGEGERGLACCSPWDRKESDTTEQLNWTDSHVWLCDSMESSPPSSLCPWVSSGENTGVGYHALFQWTFLSQGLNLPTSKSLALASRFFSTNATFAVENEVSEPTPFMSHT